MVPGDEIATAEPDSGLAALRWETPFSWYQRVYYKAPYHSGICEGQYIEFDRTWKPIALPVWDAAEATSIAAVVREPKIWVFYQNKGDVVREVVRDSGNWDARGYGCRRGRGRRWRRW